MSLFSRFREEKPRVIQLLEEQNVLLRELIQAITGRPAIAARAQAASIPVRIRTDKDVTISNRATVLAMEQEEREKLVAPWRTPASGPASGPSPSTPNPGPAPAATPPAPSVLL